MASHRREMIMKKALMLMAIISSLAGVSLAELPPRGYLSLYADGARAFNAYCPLAPNFSIAKIEMWVWALPGENGLHAADFAVAYPSNVIHDRIVYNSLISAGTGSLLAGYSGVFGACQWDWSWIAHQSLYVNTRLQTYAEIAPHPAIGFFQFYNCQEGYPDEPCMKGTSLYLNTVSYPCLPPETAIGSESSTWGAVKSLYGEQDGR